MKKIYFLFLVFLFANNILFAQRNCGTMEHLEYLIQENPDILSDMQQVEEHANQVIANGIVERNVITIPVVVHIVYNTSTQNISISQVQSQINILNQDFRKLNADRTNTPSTFTSLAADSEIEFCLASIDPNGNATTGITRTSTSVSSFDQTNKMKYSSTGGINAWPANKYLNIWVCNLGGGLLGYAQFPGGAAATDGVVIGYNYFGNTGTATAPFNKGRTATHEVGHWLNLRHIWGDANCGNDLVSDTPVHYTSNSGCPSHPKSNSCGTSAEMHMNYMDYTNDACMNMFSNGQKTRMRALFASGGTRAGLLTSNGCGGSTTTNYCASKSNTTQYEWISNVKLNTINNTSTGSVGYADYTGISTSLSKGTAYSISLSPGFAGTQYTEYFKVWIDYNQNKIFDSNELVYTSAGTTSAVNGSFTVPTTALTGVTRMRIVMKDGAISGPCEMFSYGEVEDYSVNITTATVSCGTPTGLSAGNITVSGATLNWTAVSGAGSYNIRYRRSGTTTWSTITSTTTSRSISGLSASTSYEFQVQAVCSGVSGNYSASSTFTTAANDVTLTLGTGTGTSGMAPYGTYYMDERTQIIITKTELANAGWTSSNNILKSIAFNVATNSTQVMNGFTVRIKHITSTAFASGSFLSTTGSILVYSANYTATAGWNTHNFSTNFSYNGTDHLLIDICWNNSSYTTDSKVYVTGISAYRTLYYRADVASGTVCGTGSGTRTYSRPNMKFSFGSSSTAKVEIFELEEEFDYVELNNLAGQVLKSKIYPNPATSNLNIEYAITNDNTEVSIAIVNVVGKEVFRLNPGIIDSGLHSLKVDLNQVPLISSGVYFVSIMKGEEKEVQRLIISR